MSNVETKSISKVVKKEEKLGPAVKLLHSKGGEQKKKKKEERRGGDERV